MRKILVGATLGVAMGLLAGTAAEAGSQAPKKAANAPKEAKAQNPAKVSTFQLHGVRWYRGLAASKTDRQAAKRPVLWLRVLGDPTGKT